MFNSSIIPLERRCSVWYDDMSAKLCQKALMHIIGHVAGLAGVVTADLAASHPQLGAAQRKLQGSCAALASVEGFLHSSVTAALASALVQVRVSPSLLRDMEQCMPCYEDALCSLTAEGLPLRHSIGPA